MDNRTPLLRRVWRFYADGFRQMTIGRTLWAIALIKLFVIFAILRVFFFQPHYSGLSDQETASAVSASLLTDD